VLGRAQLDGYVTQTVLDGTWLNLLTAPTDAIEIVVADTTDTDGSPAVQRLRIPQWSAVATAVLDRWAYVATGSSTVRIADVSCPLAPRVLAQMDASHPVHGLLVVGRRLLIWGDARLTIADLSDPNKPSIIGGHEADARIIDVDADGTRLFVSVYKLGVRVLDAAHPQAVVTVGAIDGKAPGTLRYQDGRLYARTFEHMVCLSVADDGQLAELSRMELSPSSRGAFAVRGHTVYLTRRRDDVEFLQVFEYAEPAAPDWVGEHPLTGRPLQIALAGDYAIIAGTSGTQVLDVSDVRRIHAVKTTAALGRAEGVATRGRDAVVAHVSAGLVVFPGAFPGPPLAQRVFLPAAGLP
jgi:hypothetical protein